MTKLPRVDIIFACADMSPDLIDASVNNGAKGIVIAGVGNGNMNKRRWMLPRERLRRELSSFAAAGWPTGIVGRNVEVKDDELGFVASDELNPQKSRILLSLALLRQFSGANSADVCDVLNGGFVRQLVSRSADEALRTPISIVALVITC